jgi:FkbM family methyltransferase
LIPRVIHRIWLGASMPQRYRRYGEHWAELNPDWEVRDWTADSLPRLRNQALFDLVDLPAQKCDIARLELVHRLGGLYVDCDFEPLRPVGDLFANHHLALAEQVPGGLVNSLFAATTANEFLDEAIRRLPRWFSRNLAAPVPVQTGPDYFTDLALRLRVREDPGCRIFPAEYFFPYPWYARSAPVDYGDAYAVHHWAKTWLGPRASPPPQLTDRRAALRALGAAGAAGSILHVADAVGDRGRSGLRRAKAAVARRVRGPSPPVRHSTNPVAVGDDRILLTLDTGEPFRCVAADLTLTPTLVARGTYEPYLRRFIRRVVPPGGLAVDVGSNIGLMTLDMAVAVGPEGRVIAFEPNAGLAALTRENLQINWLHDRVDVRAQAVSATIGETTLFVGSRHLSLGTTMPSVHEGIEERESISVPTVTLDNALDDEGYVDFLKIDVEGGEQAVLRGVTGLLAGRRIGTICLELLRENHPDWLGMCDLLRSLSRSGARFGRPVNDGDVVELPLDDVLMIGRFDCLLISFSR